MRWNRGPGACPLSDDHSTSVLIVIRNDFGKPLMGYATIHFSRGQTFISFYLTRDCDVSETRWKYFNFLDKTCMLCFVIFYTI